MTEPDDNPSVSATWTHTTAPSQCEVLFYSIDGEAGYVVLPVGEDGNPT